MPVISSISGKPAGEEIAGPDYWRREFCQPVRFADGIATLDEQGYRIFLEIGPQPKLLGLGRRCMRQWAGLWLPSLKRGQPAWQVLLSSLAKLYAQGVKIDWTGLHRGQPRRREVLPTYPFQRQRYWLAEEPGGKGDRDLLCEAPEGPSRKRCLSPFLPPTWKTASGTARGGVEIARIILRRRGPAAAARAAGIGQTADTKAGKGLGARRRGVPLSKISLIQERPMGFWEGETCEHCGGPIIERAVSLHRQVRGKYVLIEHVPAGVCKQCGTRYTFAADVAKDDRGKLATRALSREAAGHGAVRDALSAAEVVQWRAGVQVRPGLGISGHSLSIGPTVLAAVIPTPV